MRFADPPIIAAFIAAGVALGVALIQLFGQRKQARTLETLKLQLEKQKTEHSEYLKTYLKMRIDGQERQLQAFKGILQSVQLLRDKIKGVLLDPGAFDGNLLSREIKTLAERVAASYAENQIHLPEEDRVIAHSLKNECLRLETAFHHKGDNLVPDLAPFEARLAELQSRLRENAERASDALVEAIAVRISEERDAR
ncbi:MAG: hypothetical protein ABSC23_06485 [Bryobacteraceae bacterium]|jgi:anion-transporting  ArsA/GET3 family ATPase